MYQIVIKFLKNQLKNIITISLVVLVCVFLLRDCKGKAKVAKSLKNLEETRSNVKTWKDKYNREHSRAESATIRGNKTSQYIQELRGLRGDFTELKKNLKNLQSSTSTSTRTITNFRTVVRDSFLIHENFDTIPISIFRYEDDWTLCKGQYDGDTVYVECNNIDSLHIVGYYKRSWFLGKKRYFTEVISKNPNTSIIYNRSIVVRKK